VGSGAGVGTSSCGGGAAAGKSACLGRMAKCAAAAATSRTVAKAARMAAFGFFAAARKGAPPETPGMRGISGLKRSEVGWSGTKVFPRPKYSKATVCGRATKAQERVSNKRKSGGRA